MLTLRQYRCFDLRIHITCFLFERDCRLRH
jgi:hypothetical protein